MFWSHVIVSCVGTDCNLRPYSLKWIRLIHSSCWMRRQQQNYMLYNMHLIVMMRLHCGICPHCSWAVWRRAVCVFLGHAVSAVSAAGSAQRRVCLCVCSAVCWWRIRASRGWKHISRSHAAFSAPRRVLIPQRREIPAREAPTHSSPKDSPSRWQIRADMGSGGKRSGRERTPGGLAFALN